MTEKTYEFEMPLEGYVMIAVEAESEEEARRLLGDGEGYEGYQEVEYSQSAADVPLLEIYDENGDDVVEGEEG